MLVLSSIPFFLVGYIAGRWHAKRIAAAEYAARVKDDLRVQPSGGGGGGPLEPL